MVRVHRDMTSLQSIYPRSIPVSRVRCEQTRADTGTYRPGRHGHWQAQTLTDTDTQTRTDPGTQTRTDTDTDRHIQTQTLTDTDIDDTTPTAGGLRKRIRHPPG